MHDSISQSWLFTIYCRLYVRQFICRPVATLYDPYTAKITGNRYNYEWHFNGVLQAPHPAACKPQPETLMSFVGLCTTKDLRRLISTFWRSSPNIVIILDYKWNTKLIFLRNVLPVYSKMALKCSCFALITRMMMWAWCIAACWN